MTEAFKEVWGLAKSKNISLRDAAFALGVKRIVDAMKLRRVENEKSRGVKKVYNV